MKKVIKWIGLGLLFAAATLMIRLNPPALSKDIDMLVMLFVLFLAVKTLFIRSHSLSTASSAVVMAAGIFLEGVFWHFPIMKGDFGKVAALAVFLLWAWLMGIYMKGIFNSKERERHFGHPIHSFAVGTWVATTSVCGTLLHQQVPEMNGVVYAMAIIGALFWLFFFYLVLRNFTMVYKKRLYLSVHGIVLFSTVATQALVIFYNSLFRSIQLQVFSDTFLLIGALFYVTGFLLILSRYTFQRRLDLKKDWDNTNCILHGGMAITGLACIVSHAVPGVVITGIWVWSLVWFVTVEFIEVIWAVKRVKAYGFVKGIGTFNASQWCRNFTFGMFFAFTLKINLSAEPILYSIRGWLLSYGIWLVLMLLLYEITLFFWKYGGQETTKTNHESSF